MRSGGGVWMWVSECEDKLMLASFDCESVLLLTRKRKRYLIFFLCSSGWLLQYPFSFF